MATSRSYAEDIKRLLTSKARLALRNGEAHPMGWKGVHTPMKEGLRKLFISMRGDQKSQHQEQVQHSFQAKNGICGCD